MWILVKAIMEVSSGITLDPEIRFGKPCIKGTRIDVTPSSAGSRLEKTEEIEDDYELTEDQIMPILAYAAHVVQDLPPAVKFA